MAGERSTVNGYTNYETRYLTHLTNSMLPLDTIQTRGGIITQDRQQVRSLSSTNIQRYKILFNDFFLHIQL